MTYHHHQVPYASTPRFTTIPLLLLLLTTIAIFNHHQPTPTTASAMKLVIQRVKRASVTTTSNQHQISTIGPGILALVGLHQSDTLPDLHYCAKKLLAVKLWENTNGSPWRQHVQQKSFEILCVSQFTLYGTLSKKNQPDYKLAMKAEMAQTMYNTFLELLKEGYERDKIMDGKFGAMMDVELVNDGPVTLVIDSRDHRQQQQQVDSNENNILGKQSSSLSVATEGEDKSDDDGKKQI